MDQDTEATDPAANAVCVMERDGEYVVVRKEKKGYALLSFFGDWVPPKFAEAAPVVGVVKALVWRKL